jgi:ankyrin repeat protein
MRKLCHSSAWAILIAAAVLVGAGCNPVLKHSAYRDIHAAARDGDAAQVAADLAQNPGDLNLPDDAGLTPLHLAASSGHTNVVVLLLDKGAKIDSTEKDGATPLHFAAQEGCLNAVKLLLDRGASVNARDKQGRTPLTRSEQWHQDSVGLLLRARGGLE